MNRQICGGGCGYSIGSREYLNYVERKVLLQDLPAIYSDDYDGGIKDSLEDIARQLQRDLSQNERENNYITDDTARNLRAAVSELEHCGISTGISDSMIERLAWFVGGDAAKIRQLQQRLNELNLGGRLLEDGVYGKKTDGARESFLDELARGTFPTLAWLDPLQSSWTGIRAATKITRDGRNFSRLVSSESNMHFSGPIYTPTKGIQAITISMWMLSQMLRRGRKGLHPNWIIPRFPKKPMIS